MRQEYKNDLGLLGSVMTLESATDSLPSSGVSKEHHLFKSFYDAASSSVDARLSKADFRYYSLANTSLSTPLLPPANQQPILFVSGCIPHALQTKYRVTVDRNAEWMPQTFETALGAEVYGNSAQPKYWLNIYFDDIYHYIHYFSEWHVITIIHELLSASDNSKCYC